MSIVRAEGLSIEYRNAERAVPALLGVDLDIAEGGRVGIVGESGSGKSTLGAAIGRLLPPSAVRSDGSLTVDGIEVFEATPAQLRELRRNVLGFIPQDPIGALDPTARIGRQLRLALGLSRREAREEHLASLLGEVLIRDPERVLRLYPHEVSGGMAQRVVVAMTMAKRPRILVADEPTASLDALVRHEVLSLIFGLAERHGTTVVWLSHDLDAVARWCDRVAVMSAARVVEEGPATRVLSAPVDPYTRQLVDADPRNSRLLLEPTVVAGEVRS